MMLLEQLHANDLSSNSGKILRQQLIENFKIIQAEDSKDDNDRKSVDKKLQDQIDKINIRLDDLDKTKATHNEVQAAEDEWKKKIEHVALGTDYETVEQVVMQILKEKGLV